MTGILMCVSDVRLSTLNIRRIKTLDAAQLEEVILPLSLRRFQVPLSRQAFCSVMSLTPFILLHSVPLTSVMAIRKKHS